MCFIALIFPQMGNWSSQLWVRHRPRCKMSRLLVVLTLLSMSLKVCLRFSTAPALQFSLDRFGKIPFVSEHLEKEFLEKVKVI